MSAHTQLRQRTAADHDRVDAAFGAFDLDTPESYGHFLSAHARILPALEAALAPADLLPRWQGRTAALLADLAALNHPAPPAIAFDPPARGAARWGALYVVEGSRLGGAMLARGVAAGLPHAYLSAAHEPGGWSRVTAALEAAATGPEWVDAAVASASAVFAAYERAANEERRLG